MESLFIAKTVKNQINSEEKTKKSHLLKLEKTRDTLLPKLMIGTVKINH